MKNNASLGELKYEHKNKIEKYGSLFLALK